MPGGGSKKGQRRGGRVAGTPNKATVEKQRIAAEIAARMVADAHSQGRKLSKEHMQDIIPVLAEMTQHYRPIPGKTKQAVRNREFERWFTHFMTVARALAPYESATFRAVDLRATLPTGNDANPLEIMRAMLDEIDDESRAERTKAKQIEHVAPALEKKRA